MKRRKNRRKIRHRFSSEYFKPKGIPMASLEEVEISFEELETLRLRYGSDELNQHDAAKEMGISQSQYQRDLWSTLAKLTDALVNRKALRIRKSEEVL